MISDLVFKFVAFHLKLLGYFRILSGAKEFLKDYPVAEIARRALKGREAIYPFGTLMQYGTAILGSTVSLPRYPRFPSLDTHIVLLPPAFTPKRLEKMVDLLREPTFEDVVLDTEIGGFKVSMPVVAGTMGSTDIASRTAIAIAKACAKMGIVFGIGENVATVRGYSKRLTRGHPCFKERLLAYLTNVDKYGGIIIQQSVEDAYDELWNRVYSDKDVEQYLDEGLIGFEIKIGQGAKPGLGGIIKIPREQVERLKQKYHIDLKGDEKYVTRYSVPGTYTEDILRGMIRNMRTNYPRVKIWIKLGPFKDALKVIKIAQEEGAHAVVIDGKEGGTAMAPCVAMQHLGYPTLAAIAYVRRARQLGFDKISLLVAGRLYDGSHVVKCIALGCSGIYIGRPLVIAALVKGEKGVMNYLETVKVETQMLVSALGKYDIHEISDEDVASLDINIARALGIRWIFDVPQDI